MIKHMIKQLQLNHHLSKAISLLVSRLLIFLRLVRFAIASLRLCLRYALPKTNITDSADRYLQWLCLCF
mgnify:CR=1 FL=1